MGQERNRDCGGAGQAAGGRKKEGKGSSWNSFGALKKLVIPVIPCEKGNSQYDSDTPTHFPSSISVTTKSQRDFFKAHGPHPMNKVDVSSPLSSIRLMSIDKPQNSPKELGGQPDGKISWVFFVFVFLINLFIFGCVGSSFLCEGFLLLRRAGATLHRGARASHDRGLSCCGAQAPDAQAQ